MKAVLGLLLLFAGAELIYLVLTGKLAVQPAQGTGGGPDEQTGLGVSVHPVAALSIQQWGTVVTPVTHGGLLP